MSQAQHELAREYGFASWPRLVHHVQATELEGVERALVLADAEALSTLLRASPEAATAAIDDLAPLLVLLRRSVGSPVDV
ncbi:MAG: ankyrin repeat domain-containing protein, partial [Gemmatimonadota bacterium]